MIIMIILKCTYIHPACTCTCFIDQSTYVAWRALCGLMHEGCSQVTYCTSRGEGEYCFRHLYHSRTTLSNQSAQNEIYNVSYTMHQPFHSATINFYTHKLLSYLRETQMDPEASLVDHAALTLDTMDIDDSKDFKLTEEESKPLFGSAASMQQRRLHCNCKQGSPQ